MKKLFNINRGFTLIELLVAIAIIAILTGIIMTNATTARAKSRDAKRISDIGQIQLAVQVYYDRCKQYPSYIKPSPPPATPAVVTLSTAFNNGCPSSPAISLGSYMSKIPTPPAGTTYDYVVNNAALPTDFYIHVKLEQYNEVVKDGLAGSTLGWTTFSGAPTCNDAPGSVDYCVGSN